MENNKKSNDYTEEYHLNGKPKHIIKLYEELKNNVLNLGNDIEIKPVESYIPFWVKGTKVFVNVFVRNSKIRLDLCFGKYDYNDFKRNNRGVIDKWFDDKYYCGIDLKKNNELDEIISLIKQSYEYSKKYNKKRSKK